MCIFHRLTYLHRRHCIVKFNVNKSQFQREYRANYTLVLYRCAVQRSSSDDLWTAHLCRLDCTFCPMDCTNWLDCTLKICPVGRTNSRRHRLGLGGTLPRASNNWETPMLSSVINTFPPPPIFRVSPQYFWQVYASVRRFNIFRISNEFGRIFIHFYSFIRVMCSFGGLESVNSLNTQLRMYVCMYISVYDYM